MAASESCTTSSSADRPHLARPQDQDSDQPKAEKPRERKGQQSPERPQAGVSPHRRQEIIKNTYQEYMRHTKVCKSFNHCTEAATMGRAGDFADAFIDGVRPSMVNENWAPWDGRTEEERYPTAGDGTELLSAEAPRSEDNMYPDMKSYLAFLARQVGPV
ncbi:uncharacterized protein B0I36DRAFT_337884, partial [Microdochium trichocladiopsis]